MKKNEKGFTLIELLAVIVILAVIALIATPIVMNVINKSRQKAAEDSAYGVIQAVKSKYAELLIDKGDEISEGIEADFSNGGAVTGVSGETVTVTGTKPSEGKIKITSDGIVTFPKSDGTAGGTIKINNYNCSIADNEVVTCTNAG